MKTRHSFVQMLHKVSYATLTCRERVPQRVELLCPTPDLSIFLPATRPGALNIAILLQCHVRIPQPPTIKKNSPEQQNNRALAAFARVLVRQSSTHTFVSPPTRLPHRCPLAR